MKKILYVILIVAVVLILVFAFIDIREFKNKNAELNDIISIFDEQMVGRDEDNITDLNENDEIVITDNYININGLNVYGKIKIERINIEYPIIEYIDDDSLSKSICKISDNKINGKGNLCLAGHNMRNLSMFGNLKKIQTGDLIEITNAYGDIYEYQVTEKFYIKYDQTDVLDETSDPTLTLITCRSLDNTQRLVVKAKLCT